jgi:2-polyprenyl-3-methyl-5-hydroxy-6-metoxy-1,4-benzoquinol methylase
MGKLDWKAVKELETFIESPVFSRFNLLVDRQLMYEHRLQVGRLLENSGITISIWGNDTWADVLQNRDTYRGTINYDTEVPLLYRAASIIVDVPSGQLLTSVNQRVFDVLAVGGFILTTFKKDLTRFFELDKEICCYSSHNELMEKLQYYLLHPEAREEISAAGQERVFREHTYHHRAGELLEIMGKALEKRRSNVPIIMSSYASPVVCNGCGHNEGEELFRFTFPYHGAKLDFVIVQCNNCGLIYNNPQWTPEIISSFYQEKYHRNYNIAQQTADILNIAIPRSDQELDLIEEIIPKGRLLDVGSGNGSFAATAATRGWEAWGVEPYQDALNMAKYFFGKCGAIFMQGTLRNIDLPPRNFDVVVFNDVLEHVHNPRADLLKAYELLVSNGLLVVAVPDAGSIYAMVQGCNWRHWDPPYHLYGFTRQTITRFLNETGFEIIKFKSNLMYVGQMLVFARKR